MGSVVRIDVGIVVLMMVMFWNLENYFDPFVGENGNEFSPLGERHWTWKKFNAKSNTISKMIVASAERYGEYPTIIGLCEVENIFVLRHLVHNTILNSLKYKI